MAATRDASDSASIASLASSWTAFSVYWRHMSLKAAVALLGVPFCLPPRLSPGLEPRPLDFAFFTVEAAMMSLALLYLWLEACSAHESVCEI